MVTLAEILRRHWPAYGARFGNRIPRAHRAAVAALCRCRTPDLGGQLYRCACGQARYVYHSCGHRACPQCGQGDALAWVARQRVKLLPVPYFLVTFTVPAELRRVIRDHPKLCLGQLFSESAGTLQDVAQREKYLGAQLGFLGVLHTWTRQLEYHPHIHYLVPGGGLSADGLRWRAVSDPQFFLPERVLAARWRNRLQAALARDLPEVYRTLPTRIWRIGWVVDVLPVGRGETALNYLSAYIYKTALSSARLVACDAQSVTFTYQDRASGATRRCRLSGIEFLRRFLQHVLPKGFQRVRTFGWASPAARRRRERIAALLDWRAPALVPPPPAPPILCGCCQRPMFFVGLLPRPPP